MISLSGHAIEVQGHRGARAKLPENTLPAFQYAIEVGADVLEMDLGLTKDHELVVFHDPYINKERCLDQNGATLTSEPLIFDLTLEEVKRFDCGSLKNKKFKEQQPISNTKIPTLREVFDLVKNSNHPNSKNMHFNIEIKTKEDKPKETADPKIFTKKVLDLTVQYGFEKRVVIQSFDFRNLVEVKKIDSSIIIAALYEGFFDRSSSIIETYKPEIYSPKFSSLSKKMVNRIHSMGVKVIPWTANSEKDWKTLIGYGVDGIITDDPAGLIAYLKTNSQEAK